LVRSKRKQNVKKNMGGKIDQVTTRPRRSVLPFILITTRIPVYSRGSSLYDFVINTKSDHKQSRNFLLIQSRPTQSNECVCWDLSARSHDQTSTYNLHKSWKAWATSNASRSAAQIRIWAFIRLWACERLIIAWAHPNQRTNTHATPQEARVPHLRPRRALLAPNANKHATHHPKSCVTHSKCLHAQMRASKHIPNSSLHAHLIRESALFSLPVRPKAHTMRPRRTNRGFTWTQQSGRAHLYLVCTDTHRLFQILESGQGYQQPAHLNCRPNFVRNVHMPYDMHPNIRTYIHSCKRPCMWRSGTSWYVT